MNIESIIGITSGSIAIIGAIIGTTRYIRSKYKKTPTTLLFAQLTDKNLSDKERRGILRKLNKSELFNNRIKADYIDNFSLNSRGKEAILFDICDCNDIEPTDDICKGLVNCSMPSLLKQYHSKRQNHNEQTSTTMNTNNTNSQVTDSMTNTVFVSDWLAKKQGCPNLYKKLKEALVVHGIDFHELSNTNDYWCRDYMPIQTTENRFVFYKYNPNYLQTRRHYITDVKQVGGVEFLQQCEAINLDLVLDGGNVVKCGNKIVMTEKIFTENKDIAPDKVKSMLEEAFQCEIVFLPWDPNEEFGHSDGIIHYLGDNRVLFTNYEDFDRDFANQFRKILEKHFEVITLKYNVKSENNWAYVNYLHVGNLVIVPQLGIPEDEQALQQIQDVLPNCDVVGVPATEAVENGGALNCVTWNIKK